MKILRDFGVTVLAVCLANLCAIVVARSGLELIAEIGHAPLKLLAITTPVTTESHDSGQQSRTTAVPAATDTTAAANIVEYSNSSSISSSIQPVHNVKANYISHRFALIADLDSDAKTKLSNGKSVWHSFFHKATLHIKYPEMDAVRINFDSEGEKELIAGFSYMNRGAELSDLIIYNGRLLTFDDKTGLVYEYVNSRLVPWVILVNNEHANSQLVNGFKAEWATVHNGNLYVGSSGTVYYNAAGEIVNRDDTFVKVISQDGLIEVLNWSENYRRLREAYDIHSPGYVWHEAVIWSDIHQKWFFLPRKCSKDRYNETRDEYMGCNVLISADERFNKIDTVELDPANTAPTHGFSSFKFVPGTGDTVILAIKSEELNGKTQTFITAFDIGGKTILPETQIDTTYKYEGIEFI